MARVVAVSSLVARGSVGLRAAIPALEHLGHETIALPTILLSNHLGHRRVAGSAIEPDTLGSMIEALDDNGWLADADAVLTGYLPSAEHVRLAVELVGRVRALRPQALVICDPVLGDDPGGLYVPRAVAEAVRETLVPLATHLKPNGYELSFLSGLPVGDPSQAVAAARALPVPVVLASSVPAEGNTLANVVITEHAAALCTVPREAAVPHGTGDLLTALFAGHCLSGATPREAAAVAAACVQTVIAGSLGSDELMLRAPAAWDAVAPLVMTDLATGFD